MATVTIACPSPASGTVTIDATATKRNLVNLSILLDGGVLASSSTSPLSVPWDTTTVLNGNHTLQGKATYSIGTSPIFSTVLTISVSNAPPGPSPALFPVTSVFNTPIDTLPVHAQSAAWMSVQGSQAQNGLHPDFGTTLQNGTIYNGIPVNVLAGNAIPKKTVTITTYASESDSQGAGVPIPDTVKIENDAVPPNPQPPFDPNVDHHCLIVDTDTHRVHEFYQMKRLAGNQYEAGQYSTWDYQSNALRTDGWTSADAGGLPISNLLVNYDEVQAAVQSGGTVPHAFRFTTGFSYTGNPPQYLWPARHYTFNGDTTRIKMGARARLKASVNISGFSPTNQAILRTLKKYGMFMTDNGGPWFISGSPDSRWDDTDLHNLQSLVAMDNFEIVDESAWMGDPNSGEAFLNPVLTVTVNQGSGQADPTSGTSILYTAIFSAPVADFTSADVDITGTAGGTKTVTLTGGPSVYNITVGLSGVLSSGTVIASIAAGKAHDAGGIGNNASTSTDNVVTFNAPPPAGSLSLTDVGTGINRVVTIQSGGLFRLIFEAADNYGLSQWYDLVNDPAASTNLIGPAYGVTGEISTAEPGLFNEVFYGTTPDDARLAIRSAQYYFPNAPRSLTIIENTSSRIVLETAAPPIANGIGVLSNVTCTLRYWIYPDGRIYVKSTTSVVQAQSTAEWRCAVMGLQDPGHTGSIPPDTRGWIRASATQNPYDYVGASEPFVFAYWSPNTPAPYTNFAKASVLLVARTGNPTQGKQFIHSWTNFKRWGYGSVILTLPAGGSLVQNYLIQLGTQNTASLPNINTIAVAQGIANSYQSNPLPS